jgi:malonate decarboxylase alpha subunit
MMATDSAEPHERWDTRRTAKAERLRDGAPHSDGKVIKPGRLRTCCTA